MVAVEAAAAAKGYPGSEVSVRAWVFLLDEA